MRVLCIGDSLGLPRDGVLYEDTWFYRIQKSYPMYEFVSMFKRMMLINEAVDNFYESYYALYKPDVLIIQTGICDCSPRIFKTRGLKGELILKICSILKITSLFWRIMKIRGRSPDRVYTPIKRFTYLYRKLLRKFLDDGVKAIIVIEIGHCSQSVLKSNPYFNMNVDKYNKVIEAICAEFNNNVYYIHPLDVIDENCFVDGYHCNKNGMSLVYKEVKKVFDIIDNNSSAR